VLTNPVAKVSAVPRILLEILRIGPLRIVRGRQVRRAAQNQRQFRHQFGQYFAGRLASRKRAARLKRRQNLIEVHRQFARCGILELRGKLRIFFCVVGKQLLPRGLCYFALGLNFLHVCLNFVRDIETLFRIPAEFFLNQPDFIVAQRRAVRPGGILFVRTAERDM